MSDNLTGNLGDRIDRFVSRWLVPCFLMGSAILLGGAVAILS